MIRPRLHIDYQFENVVWNSAQEIQPPIHILLVDPRIHAIEQKLLAMHRPRAMVGRIARRAHPLEVTHHVAANARMNVCRLWRKRRTTSAARNRLRQIIGRCATQRLICIRKMLAVELVEIAVVGRMMLGAVPPIPVAALRDQNFLPRQLALRSVALGAAWA